MSNESLGRLDSVELRKAWESESGDFTPWLAREENLKLLGETIGIELECEAQEKDVGPFRADILCKDTSNGTWVLIENQLEKTDHCHPGQLLTHAAGMNAIDGAENSSANAIASKGGSPSPRLYRPCSKSSR